MISHGQARRIAAEWQAPGNAMSELQSRGTVHHLTADEIDANIETVERHPEAFGEDAEQTLLDLRALRRYCEMRLGQVQVAGWSDMWDSTPATPDDAMAGPYDDGSGCVLCANGGDCDD
jgi:integrase